MRGGQLVPALALLAGLSTALSDASQFVLSNEKASSSAPKAESPFNDAFNKYVDDLMDEWKLAGMAVAVIDDQEVFTQAYGYSNLPDTKATPETLWFVGSTTKAQLGATLSHLITSQQYPSLRDGWLTHISSIIRDDFVLQDDYATAHLNLEDAVSHRSGMPSHDLSLARSSSNASSPVRDIVRHMRTLPIHTEPRIKYNYCNLMFIVLSHVVETVTGRPLRDVLASTIWKPLGMTSTFIDTEEAKASGLDLSTGYWYDSRADNGKAKYVPMENMPTPNVAGAGAIISSVVDWAKWVKALIHRHEFLSAESHEDLRNPRFIMPSITAPSAGNVAMYTLGWGRQNLHGELMFTHTGSTGTHGAVVYWFPEKKYGVVLMNNYPSVVMGQVAHRLMEDKLNVPEEKRRPENEIAREELKTQREQLANATNILYPDLPRPRLPPSVPFVALEGTYHDEGYGSVTLSMEPHPTRPDEVVLVADRSEFVFTQKYILEHTSGNFWTMYVNFGGDNPMNLMYFKAEFKFGPNGKVSGLEVEYGMGDVVDAVVLFERQ